MLFYLVYSSFMFELRSFSVFACLGFLSPANRGALMTCSLVSSFVVLVCCIVCKMVFSLNKGMCLLFLIRCCLFASGLLLVMCLPEFTKVSVSL